MLAALIASVAGARADGGPAASAPPLPPDCAVQQQAECVETRTDISIVSVAPQAVVVGGTVVVTVTPIFPCPNRPVPEEELAGYPNQRCGGTPLWGFGAEFLDNLKSGTVDVTPTGPCDASTLSCSFRINAVTQSQAPGSVDPLPAWLSADLRLSWAEYDGSRPVGSRTVIRNADVDAPFWVVRRPPSAITIVAETASGPDPQDFPFAGTSPIGDFVLDTDPASGTPDRRTFDDLAAGAYTITEAVPTGWRLGALTCSDPTGDTTVDLAQEGATVALAEGEIVSCTYRNDQVAGDLVVNVVGDEPDADVGDGRCDASPAAGDQCTLRAAVEEANERAGQDTIRFDVPGSGVPTIPVATTIVATDQVVIDGTSQPGSGQVELDGGLRDADTACQAASPLRDGLVLTGAGSIVRGLALHSFPGYALVLGGSGGHAVERSFVGTDVTGTIPRGNGLICGGGLQPDIARGRAGGILVLSASNHIGGSGVGNVISGNQVRHPFENQPHCQQVLTPVGLHIRGSETLVEGNVFGLDPSGARLVDVPNDLSSCGAATQTGILVEDAVGTRIGGVTAAARNVITSGDVGIVLTGATGTTIEGNFIGTDGAGTTDPAPDLVVAVGVLGGGVGTRIVGNVISGNGVGLELHSDVVVEDNSIGVAAVGDTPLGNAESGVTILGSGNRLVRNTIAYSAPSSLPNFGQGVEIVGGTGNHLTENRIFGNGTLGIDLAVIPNWGVTLNDAGFDFDSGPNGLQNFPAIGGALEVPGGVRLSGSLDSAPLTTFSIEVFASALCDASGHGEGARYLGRFAVTTGVLGDAFIDHIVTAPVSAGEVVTATATDPGGNTSEFSACRTVSEDVFGLSAAAPAGSTRLEVRSTDGLVGRVVALGTGATLEKNYVDRIGSLILARPTRFAHAAGEPVAATDDMLFVSVDKAVITRSARLPDVAVLNGRLRAIQGRSVACGEDVTLSLDGSMVAEKVPGTRFTRQSGNRCVFVAKTNNGIGRLELDLGKGTWNAQVIRRDLERLTNPVDVGLRIGDDAGVESLSFRVVGPVWTYTR